MSAAPRPPTNKWLVTISITFGTLMGTIDASIVNVAVPHLKAGVGATTEEITWVGTGFALAKLNLMPLTGLLGPHIGHNPV
jgi:DHA2 family multidrug resistance protein